MLPPISIHVAVTSLFVLICEAAALASDEGGRFAEIAGQTFWVLLLLVVPFLVFTLIVHWLEHKIQYRMAERFGWRSVLWTAWLGTPIHELSHAAMCKVFKHRIDEMELFEPDFRSGRLGYVRHSFKPGDWFAELGNFFIGLAPLVGGSLSLTALLWFFYPEAAQQVLALTRGSEESLASSDKGSLDLLIEMVGILLSGILSVSNFLTWRFWVFMYLVLCVGGHMAPSRSDYDGASRGVFWVSLFLIGSVLLVAMIGLETKSLIELLVQAMTPIFAILTLAIVICSFATAIVYGLTAFFPRRYTFDRS